MNEYSKIDYLFFDIPVYRVTQDAHFAELASEKHKYDAFRKQASQENYDALIDHLQTNVWPSWQYDDIVGWIRLFVVGSQIQAEYWWNRAKRQVKDGRKRFQFRGKAFELDVRNVNDSAEISRLLINQLASLTRERPFKGRHIDLTLLSNIIPYVNWLSLVRD